MSTPIVVLQWVIFGLYFLGAAMLLACCDRALTRFWFLRHRSQLSLRITELVIVNYCFGWIQFLNGCLGMLSDLILMWNFYDTFHWLITRIWLMSFLASLMTISWRVTWHYTLSRYEAEKFWKSELQMKLNKSWMLGLTPFFKTWQRTMIFYIALSILLCAVFVLPTIFFSSRMSIASIQSTGAVVGSSLIFLTAGMVYQTSDMGNLYGSRDELTNALVCAMLGIITSLAIDLSLRPNHFWNKILVNVRNIFLLSSYFYFSVHRSVQTLTEVEDKTSLSLTMTDDDTLHKTDSVQQITSMMRRVLSNYESFVLLTEHCVSEMSVEGILFIVWYMRAKQLLFVFLRDREMYDIEAAIRHLDDIGLDVDEIDTGLIQNINGLTPEMIEIEKEKNNNYRGRPSFLRYLSDTRPSGGLPFKPKLPTMQQSLSEKTESLEYFKRATTLERLADPISNASASLRNRYPKSKSKLGTPSVSQKTPLGSPVRSLAIQTNSLPTVSMQTGKTHGKRNRLPLDMLMDSPKIAVSPVSDINEHSDHSKPIGNKTHSDQDSGIVIIPENCDETSDEEEDDDDEFADSSGNSSTESEIIGLKDLVAAAKSKIAKVDSASMAGTPKVSPPLTLYSEVSNPQSAAQSGSYSSLATPSANKLELEDGSVSRMVFTPYGIGPLLVPSISNPTETSPTTTPSGLPTVQTTFSQQSSSSSGSTHSSQCMIPKITIQHAQKPSLLDVLRGAQASMEGTNKQSKLSRSISRHSMDDASPGVLPFQRRRGKRAQNKHCKLYYSEVGKLIYLPEEVFAETHIDKLESVTIEDISSALLNVMDTFIGMEGLHAVNVSNKARVSALKYRDRLSVIHGGDSSDDVVRSVSHSLRLDKKIKIIIRCIFCLDCVISEVMRMLRSDSFTRFMLSDDYLRWCHRESLAKSPNKSVSPGLE